MKTVKESKISELIPDGLNMNKHTEYGMHLLEKSISDLGLGRSIVVDKNNKIIGGNGVVETAVNLGLEDIIIVPTDGKKLVVVKREDVDINSKIGRELCLADNATAKANIEWDQENISKIQAEWDLKPSDWGIPENEPEKEPDPKPKKVISTRLIIECGDVSKLEALFNELQDRGFKCEIKE